MDRRWRRWAQGFILLVLVALARTPRDIRLRPSERTEQTVTTAVRTGIAGIVGVVREGLATVGSGETAGGLPDPTLLVGWLLLSLIITGAVVFLIIRGVYGIWARVGEPVTWARRKGTPESFVTRSWIFFGLIVAVVLGTFLLLPSQVGSFGEEDGGVMGTADDFVEQGYDEDTVAVFKGDAIRPGAGGEYTYDRPTPDADGDRLKDGWERAGRTPDGVELPNADPQRMDLYVQINYDANADPLTTTEREQLRAVWSRMPVENPDGSRGITLHIDDSAPRGGQIDQTVAVAGRPDRQLKQQFYTEQYLGNRTCRYHQVVVGRISDDRLAGWGSMPGYWVMIDGTTREDYNGNVSFRVHIITHELLHNVAGAVGGGGHTNRGWLTPVVDPGNEFLSTTTATKLNRGGLAGSGYFQDELCS